MRTSSNQTQSIHMPGWALIPLRLFLGITFIYAGLQKLADPQYFQPAAAGYIGKQIAAFAKDSPLHTFILQAVVPHAAFFGALVAYGEVAIGIGTILGLLLRPAAFFGLLLNVLFFLTATWRVYPYFYGSDIVFIFCWLTLLIAGPAYTGLPSLDTLLVQSLLSPEQQARFAPVIHFFLGVKEEAVPTPLDRPQGQYRQASGNTRPAKQSRYSVAQRTRETRRNFLLGALTGGVSILGLTWLWDTFHASPQGSDSSAVSTATPTQSSSATATSSGTPTASGTAIAQANAVQNNSAVTFTLASNGDPGILVRLNNGKFVAYDSLCTHAGCPVDYDPSSKLLVCPCHGAQFDPAKAAAVVQGPAATPLTGVPLHVDSKSGAITEA